jgi:hypothetical protein
MEEMTEEQMFEELKTWDDDVWQKFKQTNYDIIFLGSIPDNKND